MRGWGELTAGQGPVDRASVSRVKKASYAVGLWVTYPLRDEPQSFGSGRPGLA
jgi:hypothetical protein